MKIQEIILALEELAALAYQESYDNCGLLTGEKSWECTGIICTLDATEEVVKEAILKKCNLIVTHHPIIFSGLKKITGSNYIENTIITSIKNDIAIYAIHTNLDNVLHGVNKKIADALGLINQQILQPKSELLKKLVTFVPANNLEKLQQALFNAGGGNIGNYSECSFWVEGVGSFKGNEHSNPVIGEKGKRMNEKELKLEVIFPHYLQKELIKVLLENHVYEEVAYDIYNLSNEYQIVGSGIIADLREETTEALFLKTIAHIFNISVIKHSNLLGKKIKKVAVCGGAGSFLIKRALASNADIFITSDVKYHEYFDAEDQMVLADIGHWESEQFTIDLFFDVLSSKFPNFAVLKTEVKTNPVNYYLS